MFQTYYNKEEELQTNIESLDSMFNLLLQKYFYIRLNYQYIFQSAFWNINIIQYLNIEKRSYYIITFCDLQVS